MQPEVSGGAPAPVRSGGWMAWPLLVLCALPVAVTLLVGRRVLTGNSTVYGDLPAGLPLRERAALLLNFSTNEVQLLVPLVGLLALVWLVRPGAGRPPRAAAWCGAALAGLIAAMALAVCAVVAYLATSDEQGPGESGFLGPRDAFLEFYGARVATSLLLAALAIGLTGALVSAARRPVAVPSVADHEEPEPVDSAPVDADRKPAAEPELSEPEPVDDDPHARFRRPS